MHIITLCLNNASLTMSVLLRVALTSWQLFKLCIVFRELNFGKTLVNSLANLDKWHFTIVCTTFCFNPLNLWTVKIAPWMAIYLPANISFELIGQLLHNQRMPTCSYIDTWMTSHVTGCKSPRYKKAFQQSTVGTLGKPPQRRSALFVAAPRRYRRCSSIKIAMPSLSLLAVT